MLKLTKQLHRSWWNEKSTIRFLAMKHVVWKWVEIYWSRHFHTIERQRRYHLYKDKNKNWL